MNAIQGIEDGMDQINHVEYLTPLMVDPKSQAIDPADSPNVKKVIKLLLEHHTVVDDTLALMEVITAFRWTIRFPALSRAY